MKISYVSRAYVLDQDNNIFLIKHQKDGYWILPGGHLEDGETPIKGLKRTLKNELGTSVEVLGIRNYTNDQAILMHPLPISIHETEYFSQEKDHLVRKCEFRYFVKVDPKKVKLSKEIADSSWFSIAEINTMKAREEVHLSLKDILDQNGDLLELL